MSSFLRLLSASDKTSALSEASSNLRMGKSEPRYFEVPSELFDLVPAKPFAYWAESNAMEAFAKFPSLEESALATSGTGTLDDFRFVRCWWEASDSERWVPFAKGGEYSPIYFDHHLTVNWANDGAEMKEWIIYRYGGGHWARNIRSTEHYYRPGLTWPRRTQGGLSLRAMPAGCIFADKGPAVFVKDNDPTELLALLAIANSKAFHFLVSLQMAFGSYEVGVIKRTPLPSLTEMERAQLATLARQIWSLKLKADSSNETSHAYALPFALQGLKGCYQKRDLSSEINEISRKIDKTVFDLYQFSETDPEQVNSSALDNDLDTEAAKTEASLMVGLLSWVVGVAFGRFDWRLATGEREAPPEPDPFDPLPSKSPGMLPEGSESFHHHAGILVDDDSHQQDLPRLMEQVLETVNMPISEDVRRWLRKDFFPFHLQRYSKSRRKAPIYWPLSTVSGSYTLWLYYPELTSQTLFTAVNDFVGPKLNSVRDDLNSLRIKVGGRTNQEEKELEKLEDLERELAELNDTLLGIAPSYRPNQDDGVQISAAPLWSLFRHKPWQKVLKDTWKQLEKGDFDWAHLALNYWPQRVRQKCKTDKSLAIAHGLTELFVESNQGRLRGAE